MAKLWGGRFSKNTNELVDAFNASIDFDKRLYHEDIRGSIAHAGMLAKCGIIPAEDGEKIIAGLKDILADIEAGNFKSIALTHHFCNWATFALYSLVAFVAMYFGHGVIQAIADGLPAWANAGLNGVAALLPALGFALLLNIIFEKDLTPYLIIGFVLAAYAGQAITMVGITLIAFAIAMIIYQIRSNQGTVVQSASALDDEWED